MYHLFRAGVKIYRMKNLAARNRIFIKQIHELGEWLGFETRNKYGVFDADGAPIGFAAEQQKGILGFFMRQYLGHWRSFTLLFFHNDRSVFLRAEHPFRFYFQRLEIFDATGAFIGALQRRFSILSKRFDVESASGQVICTVDSPFWKFWTFPFIIQDKEVAVVSKKWSGAISEIFTDRDNFMVEYFSPLLDETHRRLILAAALFIDLQYFEAKASNKTNLWS